MDARHDDACRHQWPPLEAVSNEGRAISKGHLHNNIVHMQQSTHAGTGT